MLKKQCVKESSSLASKEDNICQLEILKKIVKLVAKDSITDSLPRTTRLHKKANTCRCKNSESIADYLDRFTGPAMSYLDLTKADQDSSESPNLAIPCLTNARLTSQTFANTINSVVNICKTEKRDREASVYVNLRRMEECVMFINEVKSKYPEHSSQNDFES